MVVKELMTNRVCFAKQDATVKDAVDVMRKYNIGLIPVCNNKGCIIGIVTDRDIVIRCSVSDSSIDLDLPVSEIMTKNISTLTPDLNIHDASCIFSKAGFHRLPVVENEHLVGILSITDLAKKRVFLSEVGDIMGALSSNSDR